MDTRSGDTEGSKRVRRVTARRQQVLATAALTVGMAAGGYGIAHARDHVDVVERIELVASSSGGPAAGAAQRRRSTTRTDRAGPGETLLTGDKAAKATAAAKAAVPGGTIIRVETDANQGATYEAHMNKSDGSEVTVLMDANFKVTSVVPFGPPVPARQRRTAAEPPRRAHRLRARKLPRRNARRRAPRDSRTAHGSNDARSALAGGRQSTARGVGPEPFEAVEPRVSSRNTCTTTSP